MDSCFHTWDIERSAYLEWPPQESALYKTFTLDDYEEERRKTKIKYAIHLQVSHTIEENFIISSYAEEYYCIAGYIGWLDLTDPDARSRLFHMKDDPFFIGVSHHLSRENREWILRPDVVQGLMTLANRELPFDLVLDPSYLKYAMHVAYQIPNLKLVLNHCGQPDLHGQDMSEWTDDIRYLAQYPNVYCKLSGFHSTSSEAIKPYVDVAVNAFGPERCLFGSRWPFSTTENISLSDTVSVLCGALDFLNMDDQEKIFSTNASRVYDRLNQRPYDRD